MISLLTLLPFLPLIASLPPPNQHPLSLPTPNLSPELSSLALAHAEELNKWLAANSQPALVEFEGGERKWTTEGGKAWLVMEGRKFVDVTPATTSGVGELVEGRKSFKLVEGYANKLRVNYKPSDLSPAFDAIPNESQTLEWLRKFTAFRTRHYRTSTGEEASKFLQAHLKEVIAQANINDSLRPTVEGFKHSGWGQESVVVKFPGNEDKEKVIVGAHLDSTNFLPFLPAPGADDDASGTTSILGAFHGLLGLLESGWSVEDQAAVEFHWYSAEEGGLLGSKDVARSYVSRGLQVRGMVQIDMTAFVDDENDETIGIFEDNVNPHLTDFMEKIISTYSDVKSKRTTCGYGCSDHASWNNAGAPACAITENVMERTNKRIHSGGDTVDQGGYSVKHVREFSKIVAAWAVELAGWKKE